MAYKFKTHKSLDEQARRIREDQTRAALTTLDGWEQQPAEAVHRARQIFKRCRSLLQLIRDADPYVFAVENRFFRSAGQSCSTC